MAIPSKSTEIEDIASTSIYRFLPGVVDNVYNSNPLFVRLASKNRIMLDGGMDVRQPFIYAKKEGGSYRGQDVLNTARKKTKSSLIFDWKQYYANIVLDGLTELQNAGAGKVIDLMDIEMEEAQMKLRDDLGTDLFGDGTGNDSKAITGLTAVCDDNTNVTTYGGVSRSGGDDIATAVIAQYDGTGGALSLALLQTSAGGFGACTIEPEKPDLIITTQAIWDKIWARVQPSQRYPQGAGFDDLAKVGFRTIDFNGAAVVVDSHCQANRVYFLNTNYIKLVVHTNRNFVFSGWRVPSDQDSRVGYIFFAGEVVCSAPRLQGQIRNVT